MKRTAMAIIALCITMLTPRIASSALYYGFTIGVTNAPPPPVIRVAREPHVTLVSDAMVYVVDDQDFRCDGDVFRYGQYWFVYESGYWYRSRMVRGPYAVIDVKRVPRAILGVPRGRWKHHPMAAASSRGRGPVVMPVEPPYGRGPDHERGAGYGPQARDDDRSSHGRKRGHHDH